MAQLIVTPSWHLRIEGDDEGNFSQLQAAFDCDVGLGLLQLDRCDCRSLEYDTGLFWQDFVRLYLAAFVHLPDLLKSTLQQGHSRCPFPTEEAERLFATAPICKGAEYLSSASLAYFWQAIEDALVGEILATPGEIADYFQLNHSQWSLLGKICFHLAENPKSSERPFAFLATYAHQLSADGKNQQHLPLYRALEKYQGAKNKNQMIRLLAPIQKAAASCAFLQSYLDSGEMFHPLTWTAQEAYHFLSSVAVFEQAGIVVKTPNWWKKKNPPTPQLTITVGDGQAAGLGASALLDFKIDFYLGDQVLTPAEIAQLSKESGNLIFFKGQWVAINPEKLNGLLSQWKKINQQVKQNGISFVEGLRLLAGVNLSSEFSSDRDEATSPRVIPGKWLQATFEQLKNPATSQKIAQILQNNLQATLRPYQMQGVHWLYQLAQMRLGCMLADDMGLGKTVQIIGLLLSHKHQASSAASAPVLIIVPTSLLGNWQAELIKFAPSLRFWIAHRAGNGLSLPTTLAEQDLIITTYGSVSRLDWIRQQHWSFCIVDEAQAIKNAYTKQAKFIHSLSAEHRIVMTGTPIENNLSDLWSLFHFLAPGLLGTSKQFANLSKQQAKEQGQRFSSALRNLVRPYILRRMKTDPAVIDDLPAKTEIKVYCSLSKKQLGHYRQLVNSLQTEIQQAEGIKRKGIILSYLMRFKQLCNHPDHLIGTGEFAPAESGKFQQLEEICQIIHAKQEKVLVFTQFKSMIAPLSDYLQQIFGRPGLILHGEVPAKKRASLVQEFQQDLGPPYFILSLKAGGTGLNLTQASHVIHFDRWWNPAVENQATDRAFRIGQSRKVMVHKFICQGTLEEKIDKMLDSKLGLSQEILANHADGVLTELSNADLLKVVALDLNSAIGEF